MRKHGLLALLLLGCPDEGTAGNGDGNTFGTGGGPEPTTSSSSTTGDGPTSTPPTTGIGTTSDTTDTDGMPKLDVAAIPDAGGKEEECNQSIPTTCAEAEMCSSTVGCEFFTVDLDQLDGGDTNQFAASVSNVQLAGQASVTLERRVSGMWQTVEGPVMVDALDLYTFLVDDFHQEGTGVLEGGAYRITSDTPIVAYQFNPLNLLGQTASSDATMLFPVASWDHINHVVGWEGPPHTAYVTVAAAYDGTTVEITPSIAVTGAGTVPSVAAGESFEIDLEAGDIVEIMTAADENFSGTRVISDENHPVAVFSGGECTFVLAYSCDHVENQMSGVRLWGMQFIASRVPPRTGTPETSVWQIYASEDDTTVSFDASAEVTGVPGMDATLNAGEVLMLEIGGSAAEPGDFAVTADRPITLMNYMTGSSLAGSQGDPAMVQIPPVEQFLDRYVVLVPESWDTDVAVITRQAGVGIDIDGTPVSDADFIPVGASHEVARVPVDDGVHTFDGDAPFGVIIVGYTPVDSYAYVGGIGTSVINPDAPAG